MSRSYLQAHLPVRMRMLDLGSIGEDRGRGGDKLPCDYPAAVPPSLLSHSLLLLPELGNASSIFLRKIFTPLLPEASPPALGFWKLEWRKGEGSRQGGK